MLIIQKLSNLSKKLGIDLRIVRDDLLPEYYGGNKVRKLKYILDEARDRNFNALVTCGGTQSNHCRAVSLIAAANRWYCKLILHGNPDELRNPRGNLLLMMLSGSDIKIVESDQISDELRSAMEDFTDSGYLPFQIPGGGHCLAGSLAYADAIIELQKNYRKEPWHPDFIILASGTGTTQAGLIVGLEFLGWNTRVLGISIARRNPYGKKIVEIACQELRNHLKVVKRIAVEFLDEWVGEGYEKTSHEVLQAIKDVASEEGFILDPTYTGKAFIALMDMITGKEIPSGSCVLFWHTGGFFNLMASNYFMTSKDL